MLWNRSISPKLIEWMYSQYKDDPVDAEKLFTKFAHNVFYRNWVMKVYKDVFGIFYTFLSNDCIRFESVIYSWYKEVVCQIWW